MEDRFDLKDSGKRQTFDTGAKRDIQTGKGRYDLMSPIVNRRLAIIFEKGASKYDARNWEKGMPLGRFIDSAKRHLDQFIEGHRDEDHLGQAIWNLCALLHVEEMINRGLLPKTLNDLPNYLAAKSETVKISVSPLSGEKIEEVAQTIINDIRREQDKQVEKQGLILGKPVIFKKLHDDPISVTIHPIPPGTTVEKARQIFYSLTRKERDRILKKQLETDHTLYGVNIYLVDKIPAHSDNFIYEDGFIFKKSMMGWKGDLYGYYLIAEDE